MNQLNDLVGTTALIATLISVLFAIAALFIANRRKKHHLAMQQQVGGAHAPAAPVAAAPAPLQFRTPPAEQVRVPAPAEVAESMMYATRPTSSPLFKRLGRVGVDQMTPNTVSSPVTSEEQKSAWE